MSDSSGSRPRRTNANYSSTIKPRITKKQANRNNPLVGSEKIMEKIIKATSTNTTVSNDIAKTLGTNAQPSVVILSRETLNEQEQHLKNVDQNIQKETEPLAMENIETTVDNETQEWTQVSRNKGKGKMEENDIDKEETQSISSYETETNYQTAWRSAIGATKYKIWTSASKVPGKNIGEKLEKIRQDFKETEAISVVSEFSNNNRMIAVFYNNETEMVKGQKINVCDNETQPTYMHRAQVFKRNPEKDNMHGVKLWDIPVGMKYKDLESQLEIKYGKIERLSLRVNNMWQSAIVIFKEKESAGTILNNWSIIIGEDSFRVTQLDQNIDYLKSRGEHAARVIGLPPGITAYELMPHVEKIGAKTCYFPRTRAYRRRGEAILSFATKEDCANALNFTLDLGKFKIKTVDIKVKTCHRCHADDHLAAACPRTLRDETFKTKNMERINKFGPIYKKHNPRYFNVLNKQTGSKTYAEVTKNKLTNSAKFDDPDSDRLTRIENLLIDMSERLTALEEHVWNIAEANVEEELAEDDTEMETTEEELENTTEVGSETNASSLVLERILSSVQQLMQRLETVERRSTTGASDFNNAWNSESNFGNIQ